MLLSQTASGGHLGVPLARYLLGGVVPNTDKIPSDQETDALTADRLHLLENDRASPPPDRRHRLSHDHSAGVCVRTNCARRC